MKKYMVVEHFRPGCFGELYKRFNEKGKMLPEGLNYLNSWVNKDNKICYQLMKSSNVELFSQWTKNWDDLTEFEIVPID